MRRLLRFLSRISFRLMAFNLLLVFLPVAGILYLVSYEERLIATQRRSMETQARTIAATLGQSDEVPTELARSVLRELSASASGARVQIVDHDGLVVADSLEFSRPQPTSSNAANQIRRNLLYRIASSVARPLLRLFQPEPPLEASDVYERADELSARTEVRQALQGRFETTERISTTGRYVILYSATPIRTPREVVGAVVVSQSTVPILQDLYGVRLGIARIFVASVAASIIISLLVSMTIVRPLRQLRLDAGAILDRRGRIKGRFRGTKKLDEIGDLARALERLTRRLESHVAFIESFASDVSHEFKNPLASIRMATEMLYEAEDETQRRRFLTMVEGDIARMERLLSAVREVSAIDAQIASEPREEVALDTLLERVVEGFRLRCGERIGFELHAEGDIRVLASEARLMQVFENLLDNAVSFSQPGARIHLHAGVEAKEAIVSITDEGAGIPDSHLDRIFDRFFTWRPGSATKKGEHTGLGLSIVKSIVEGYGGTVRARNNEGAGCTFEVRLERRV
jgi:two-component system sensor histidine kinase ChvG